MGRWAQSRRTGSVGPPPTAQLIHLVEAVVDSGSEIIATWSDDVDASQFEETSFQTLPGEINSITITQVGSNSMNISFEAPIGGEETLTFDDGVAGVQSPDSIPITP